MSEISERCTWKPDFRYYEELVGIKVRSPHDVDCLIRALWSGDLLTCPHDVVGDTIVVPKEAVRLLPLAGIKHRKVELLYITFVSDEVGRELCRRFLAWESGRRRRPHYYITGKGRQRICCRYLVLLSTVRAIEAYLA